MEQRFSARAVLGQRRCAGRAGVSYRHLRIDDLHAGIVLGVRYRGLGMGGQRLGAVAGAGGREAFFDAVLAELPRTGDAVRCGEVQATGPFDWRVRRATADGAMLVGDAAGYFDPFTGQGVFRALRGAALAAEVAHRALRYGDLSQRELATYDELRRRAFAPGERLQRLIEMVVSRDRLFRLVASGLRRRPALANELVAVAGDLHPVRSLWAPATLARLIR